jgi:RNA polymerase sigma factor (TIGR02999 family)
MELDMEADVPGLPRHSTDDETISSKRSEPDITETLRRWREGDGAALENLNERIYSQLRVLADSALGRDWGSKSLQPTELVHEAYLRLMGARAVDWKSRAHFFGIASRVMRQILVDRARRRAAQKRGGSARISLESGVIDVADQRSDFVDLIGLDLALSELASQDDELSRLVELRFFSGMTVEETAEVLGVSARTVKRDWRLAKAWLKRRLSAAVT